MRIVPAASEPRVIEAVSPPSVCASGTCTVSAARLRSTTAPSSVSSYAPSSISIGTADTGITATPTSDSAAPANGSRSTDVTRPSSMPIASRRASIDAASFFLGQRICGDSKVVRMSATLIKGKPIAERIRAEVAEQVQEDRSHRPRDRPRRRRPGLGGVHPAQAQGGDSRRASTRRMSASRPTISRG